MKVKGIIFACLFFSCKMNKGIVKNDRCLDTLTFPVIIQEKIDSIEIYNNQGKFIYVRGVFRYNFEDVAIYPKANSQSTSALWIEFNIPKTISDSTLNALNGKKVHLIGRVNTLRKGHFNSYLATLDSTFCLEEY